VTAPRAIALTLALLACVMASLASADDAVVDPDRPDLTNSARTMPRGGFQLETGVEYSRTRRAGADTERRFLLDAFGRAGIAERVELQLGWQPFVHLRGDADDAGVGDVALAMKYRFFDGEAPWPTLGVRPFLKLPTADEPLGSGRVDFGAVALASFDLPAGFGLDVNAGAAAVGQSRPSGHLIQALASTSLSLDTGDLAPFVEITFASRGERDGRNSVNADAGVVCRVTKRIALDAAIQTSLTGVGPDWALRAGITFRLGR
jgi:hypothetical protein